MPTEHTRQAYGDGMEILIYPDKVLRRKAALIKDADMDEVRSIATRMLELMYKKKGVGLAGPQVSFSKRMYTVDTSEERNKPIILINPKIELLEDFEEENEGCLSFPGLYAPVKRGAYVKIAFTGLDGELHTIDGEGLTARALQHEFDHLDGVLFIDRLGAAARSALRKDLKEMEKAASRE